MGCLVDACVKCQNTDKALEIIDQEQHNLANTVVYTTLIKGFTKERNLDRALQIVDKMEANHLAKPNIVTYNSLLDCAARSQQFVQMDKIYKQIFKLHQKNNSI